MTQIFNLFFLIPNRQEPGDGGIDLFGGFLGYTIVIQCKVSIMIKYEFI